MNFDTCINYAIKLIYAVCVLFVFVIYIKYYLPANKPKFFFLKKNRSVFNLNENNANPKRAKFQSAIIGAHNKNK